MFSVSHCPTRKKKFETIRSDFIKCNLLHSNVLSKRFVETCKIIITYLTYLMATGAITAAAASTTIRRITTTTIRTSKNAKIKTSETITVANMFVRFF